MTNTKEMGGFWRGLLRARRTAARRRDEIRSACSAVEPLESRVLLSVDVLNYHNDNASTGANLYETVLTPADVNVNSFGKLFTTTVDGQVYAQPLLDTGVTIASGVNTTAGAAGVHDVTFVATENDSLYAIDADTGAILWHRVFLSTTDSGGNQNNPLGATAIASVTGVDVSTADISPVIGITGTPVIDSTTNTLYVVVATKETVGGVVNFVQRLHAINIADGTDVVTPYTIGITTNGNTNTTAIYAYGSGDGAVTDPYNGTGDPVVQFNALRENQRGALSLVDNTVYVTWASHGDNGPYHGWVVAWDVTNLTTSGMVLKGLFCTSPNDGLAGIWSGGGQLVFEPDDSAFYFLTGNGSGGAPTIGSNGLPTDNNYNEALVKVAMDPTTTATSQGPNGWGMKVVDWFIPYNVAALDGADSDFGSGAPILLPASAGIPGHPNLIVVGGKAGALYVFDRDDLGHFNATSDGALNSVPNGSGDMTPPVIISGLLSTPAYYDGKLYVAAGYSGPVYSMEINSNGSLSILSQTTDGDMGYLPGSPSISANGTNNGIVWVMDDNANEIHAYSAATMSTELWNSSQAFGGADSVGAVVKFAVPTVANGMVYVGTSDSLVVYGLKEAPNAVPDAPVLQATPISGESIGLSWTDSTEAPNSAAGYDIEESTDGGATYFQVTTVSAGATAVSIGDLAPLTTYDFRIFGFNTIGDSPDSNPASATTTAQVPGINFPNGFASAVSNSLITLNGSSQINGTALELTDGGDYEAASAWDDTLEDVTQFDTQFTFQLVNPNSDGITFTIQNAGLSALGPSGGGLGYGPDHTGGAGGIPTSVAIKFDLANNQGEGSDSTGLYIDGAAPTDINSVNLISTGINLHSGDPFAVDLSYDGTTLTETITDQTTLASFTQTYAIDIPSTVGGNSAYLGFTGGTGANSATQNILTWTYVATANVSPSAPSGLGATPASATSVNLAWTANSALQTGYHLDRATDPAFTQNLITETLPENPASFTDTATGLAPGGTYYYRIRAFDAAGDSGNSNVTSVSIPLAPPKPTDQAITLITATEIDLIWQDNAGHQAEGYEILEAVNMGSFTDVANLPPTSRTAPSNYTWDATGLTPGTYYEFHIIAYNVSGHNDFAGLNATTLTVTPNAPVAIPGEATVTLFWGATPGAIGYDVLRSTTFDGPYSVIASDVANTQYTDAPLTDGTTYYYEVSAVDSAADSTDSPATAVTPGSTVSTVPFSGGFAGAGGALTLNGAAVINGDSIQLTDNNDVEAGSAYATTPQIVTAFTTAFIFQLTDATADGFTFIIQNAGLSALGPIGGGLGYGPGDLGGGGGIPSSVAIKFDLYNNAGEGIDSTGLYTDGASPTVPAVDLSTTGINLHSGDEMQANIIYADGQMTVVLSDLDTNATAVQNYSVNVPFVVGGPTAYVGFTGATGGLTAVQQIWSWTYQVGLTPPPVLTATPASGAVALSWNTVSGATRYAIVYGTASGNYTTAVFGVAGTSETVTDLTPGTPYYFAVYGENGTGGSSYSSQAVATPLAVTQPSVSSVVVNGNLPGLAGTQRSMVDSIVYTFSQSVSIADASAFSISVDADQTGTVPTLALSPLNPNLDGSSTQWVVTFSGNGVVGNSIANGVYDIAMNAGDVTLDGYPGTTVQARPTDTFYRLYGDFTGAQRVNTSDYFYFLDTFGLKAGNAGFLAAFDFDGAGGKISTADYFQFLTDFGDHYSGFTATI